MKNYSEKRVYSLNELDSIADEVGKLFSKTSVLALYGPLGAGKTTLAQSVLAKRGVEGVIQSPTFTYVMTYESLDGTVYHHFDLYRLGSMEDFFAAGFDEYLFQTGSKALIEWPEIISPLLEHDTCHIVLDYEGTVQRTISYRCT